MLFPHASDTTGPLHAASAGSLRANLAAAQERHAENVRKANHAALSVRYSIMFELTDNLSMVETLRVIRDHVSDASLHEVIGFSQGQKEDSIIIDVLASPDDKPVILDLARILKALHHQQSVVVSYSSVTSIVV